MLYEDNYLAHFGIKGQKWGVRRFQNPDGSLTSAGKKRYGQNYNEVSENLNKARNSLDEVRAKVRDNSSTLARRRNLGIVRNAEKKVSKLEKVKYSMPEYKNDAKKLSEKAREETKEIFNSLDSLPNGPKKKQLAAKMLDDYKAVHDMEDKIRQTAGSYRQIEQYRKEIPYEAQKDSDYGTYIATKIANESMSGMDEVPISARNKALYDYDKDEYAFVPKYKKSKEYKELEQNIERVRKESGLAKAEEDWHSPRDLERLSMRELDRRYKALNRAQKEYRKLSKPYTDAQEKMWENHKKQIIKNVLMDMGWPVDEKYYSLIEQQIWYD